MIFGTYNNKKYGIHTVKGDPKILSLLTDDFQYNVGLITMYENRHYNYLMPTLELLNNIDNYNNNENNINLFSFQGVEFFSRKTSSNVTLKTYGEYQVFKYKREMMLNLFGALKYVRFDMLYVD